MNDFHTAAVSRNPAWVQLLGLCPLLAVSNTITNAPKSIIPSISFNNFRTVCFY